MARACSLLIISLHSVFSGSHCRLSMLFPACCFADVLWTRVHQLVVHFLVCWMKNMIFPKTYVFE